MYDSPVNIIEIICDEIKQKTDSDIKDAMFSVLHRRGIDIDEEKLVQAIAADRKRYEEAYRRGNEDGYKRALDEMNSKRILEEVWNNPVRISEEF